MPGLSELRQDKGLSREALAQAAGVAAELIATLEEGRTTSVKLGAMRAIADALGVEPGNVDEFAPGLGLRLVGQTGSGEGAPTGAAEPGATGPTPRPAAPRG